MKQSIEEVVRDKYGAIADSSLSTALSVIFTHGG